MKKSSIIFFQIIIALVAGLTLVFMLWEPQIEGRNAHATLSDIYFHDPFLAYAYIASIPFFLALYHLFRLTRYTLHQSTKVRILKTLGIISSCLKLMVCFVIGGEIIITFSESDDRAGGVFLGILILFFVSLSYLVIKSAEKKVNKRISYQDS